MALSGTVYGTTSNIYITSRLKWSAVQNVVSNTSTVTVQVAYWRTNSGYTTWGQCHGTVTLGGISKNFSKSISMSGSTESTASIAAELTFTVNHNAAGSAHPSFSVSGGIDGTTFTSTSLSGTLDLTAIPRATVPVLSHEELEIGQTVTVSLPRASDSFLHKISWNVYDNIVTELTDSAGDAYNWTLPQSLLLKCDMLDHISVKITVETFSAGTSLGKKEVYLMATVPQDQLPSVESGWFTLNHGGDLAILGQWNVPIQGKTKTSVTFHPEKISAAMGTWIESTSVKVLGKTVSGNPAVLPVFGQSGEQILTVTVTDSRGRTASENVTLSVYPYTEPGLSDITICRCNSLGQSDGQGQSLFVSAEKQISSVGGRNSGVLQVELCNTAFSSETVTDARQVYFTDLLSITESYPVKLTMTDSLGAVVSYETLLPTAAVSFHIREGGGGAAFGGYAQEDGKLYTGWDIETGGRFLQNGKPLRPVYDSGDSGIWHFIRYEDGFMEAWGVYSAVVTIQSPLGNWYSRTVNISYPFPFLANTEITLLVQGGSQYEVNFAKPAVEQTAEQAAVVLLAPAIQTGKKVTLRLYAAGKWR